MWMRTTAWTAVLLTGIWLHPPGLLAQAAAAGDGAMPNLPASGATVESFAPLGWVIEQRHNADFNGDRRTDILLLLSRPAGNGTTPSRILLAAMATARPAGYALSAANAQLVPRDPSGALEDPMADGEILTRPGGFDLKIGMMSAAGSYLAASLRYRFRFQGGCFRLIGYDRAETHRGTLDTRDLSVNFLTGRIVRTTGNAQSGAAESRRERLSSNPRRCLTELGNGWTFDPLAPAPKR